MGLSIWYSIAGFASFAFGKNLPSFGDSISLLGPLVVRKSAGLSLDARAVSGSRPLMLKQKEKISLDN
jgi:hypothetical protein